MKKKFKVTLRQEIYTVVIVYSENYKAAGDLVLAGEYEDEAVVGRSAEDWEITEVMQEH